MENQIPSTQLNQSVSNSVPTPTVVPADVQQPKTNSFLVILLSSLLIISVVISGFFAYQTQKLVAELRIMKDEVLIIPTATTEPVATDSAITSKVPESVSNLFNAINTNFKLNLVPVEENLFYSPSGPITKKSWKLDLVNVNLGKSFSTYIRTQLNPNDLESAAGGGGGVDAYENNDIKCFHSYGYRGGDPTNWKDPFNYLSCSEK